MSGDSTLGIVLRRIGTVAAIVRVRGDQAKREEDNGGTAEELDERIAGRAQRLEEELREDERLILP